MALQPITLHLSDQTYQRIRQRAQATKRSVEDELRVVVEEALSPDAYAGIPGDIAEEMRQLAFLDDEHLWRAAKRIVPLKKSERMQELAWKSEQEELTLLEQQEIEQLLYHANRVMLIRAEAAVLLKNRGFNISELLQPQSE